jgi:substrate-binding family protein
MNIRFVSRVIVCGLVLAFIGQAGGDQSAQLHSQRVFKVGVLVSLTGSGFSLGQSTVAALQIAEEQIEAEAISQHGGYRFKFFVGDTQQNPSKALEALKDLDKRGAQIIIGPQTSSEVRMIKPYADAHNILVISQGSTASSLSIAGDNIFRLCPDDPLEAAAIVAFRARPGIGLPRHWKCANLSLELLQNSRVYARIAQTRFHDLSLGLQDAPRALRGRGAAEAVVRGRQV